MTNLFQIFSILVLLSIASCTEPGKVVKQYSYFDLEGFFEKEASRLQKGNQHVVKSVQKNGETEKRVVKIKDWSEELSLFSASDINKPAWRDSYKTQQKAGEILYTSTDPNLRTDTILIRRETTGRIKQISIVNKIANSLYSSRETLDYFPDSLYQIYKEQDVRLLGSNKYVISGKLK